MHGDGGGGGASSFKNVVVMTTTTTKKRVLVHLINLSITSSENYLFCENEKLVKVGSTL